MFSNNNIKKYKKMDNTDLTKKEYLKQYYDNNKDKTYYKHNNLKYIKLKYESDGLHCEIFKDDLKDHAMLHSLIKNLNLNIKTNCLNHLTIISNCYLI